MGTTPAPASQASLLLQKQLKDLCKNPVDGFSAGLVNEVNIFEWNVTIFGPPDTLYEGGFFNAIMSFPKDYPCNPPVMRFSSEMWHPNVYANGKVCILILHPPDGYPNGYELATERWNPVHTVLMEKLALVSGPTPSFTRQWNQLFEKWACCKLKVESIVLSIISTLSSPNDESPANVDAAELLSGMGPPSRLRL